MKKIPDWMLYAAAAAGAYWLASRYLVPSQQRPGVVKVLGAGMVWDELYQAYVRRNADGRPIEFYA